MEGVFVGCGWCGGLAVLRHGPGARRSRSRRRAVTRPTRRTRPSSRPTAARALNVVSCEGTVPNGAAINTATVGTFPFTVSAKNAAGATLTTSVVNYQVTEDGPPTDPGGSVPATLNLNLGTPTAFTAFVPGVAQDYTSTLDGADPVHGRRREADGRRRERHQRRQDGQRHLRAAADRPGRRQTSWETGPTTLDPTAPAFEPLGGMSAPTELLTYDGPVSGSADRHLQAVDRRDGRAPHRLLLEDADLHALDDEPVVDSAKRATKRARRKAGPFCLPDDCER